MLAKADRPGTSFLRFAFEVELFACPKLNKHISALVRRWGSTTRREKYLFIIFLSFYDLAGMTNRNLSQFESNLKVGENSGKKHLIPLNKCEREKKTCLLQMLIIDVKWGTLSGYSVELSTAELLMNHRIKWISLSYFYIGLPTQYP